jgi:AcrR family transcriptional regulator
MPNDLDTTPRKQPAQARARATVQAILDATAQVLVELGYERATTNVIARRAGVSIGSLYQYFPNKEALVTALAERHMGEVATMLVREVGLLRARPLPEAIRALIEALLRAHAVEPELHRVLIEQVPRLLGFEQIANMDRMFVELIRRELEQREEKLRPPDLELAVFMLVQAVQGITHAAVLECPSALGEGRLAQEITDLVLRYLVADAVSAATDLG